MLGINGAEFLVILVIAIIVVGPERLPHYAQQFRDWVVRGRDYVTQQQATISKEMGGDVDWSTLDPRQYDPRTIVREAFAEQPAQAAKHRATATAASAAPLLPGEPAPFDTDAT